MAEKSMSVEPPTSASCGEIQTLEVRGFFFFFLISGRYRYKFKNKKYINMTTMKFFTFLEFISNLKKKNHIPKRIPSRDGNSDVFIYHFLFHDLAKIVFSQLLN